MFFGRKHVETEPSCSHELVTLLIGLKLVTSCVTNFFFRRMIFKTIKNMQNSVF